MVTIIARRDGRQWSIVWEDGEIAGDQDLLDIIEAMETAEVEVLLTPVGPTLVVDRNEPRTIIAALEDDPDVEVVVVGTLPEPSWESDETRDRDLTF